MLHFMNVEGQALKTQSETAACSQTKLVQKYTNQAIVQHKLNRLIVLLSTASDVVDAKIVRNIYIIWSG